ncbi:type VI secretion system Vgr family protein [Coralloluteibacterium thermophilus]|uniref:Type VI secretion system Vgr family protein n=1 Tax=Coralloluteibacterium thermophilum TaxID=2707049 RepID=A0ABV9NT91_9GAMM
MARIYTLHSDLGDALLFGSMHASERLGSLFSYRITAYSQDARLDLAGLLGRPMAVHMRMPDGYQRWFHGMVAEIGQDGFVTHDRLSLAVYAIRLVPRPWLLTQRRECRIFSDKSVPQIVRQVLDGIGYSDVRLSLGGDYPVREYCVQYGEDDFNFVSRLMEQEGIYYFFAHARDAHTMVLADGLGAHASTSGYASIPYLPVADDGHRLAEAVGTWTAACAVHTTTHRLSDFDPLRPRTALLATGECGQGSGLHGVSGLEAYDWPGTHTALADGERYAQVRAEAHAVERALFRGEATAAGIAVGNLFELRDFPRREWNQEYLVVATEMHMAEPGYASGGGAAAPVRCGIEAIESRLPFRSPARAPRPTIPGLQTAVVVGNDTDEDIAVDEYGRVRVAFHWSRASSGSPPPSCPVRVASVWAGKQWGALHIPRVGQEVVVSFLEGDPDRPLIIGSVYNADHMPPYALPDNRTQSGIRSRSLLGAAVDFNEIRFEDKAGEEELFFHAQKDMREEVENDHHVAVEHDEIVEIGNEQRVVVGADRTHEVRKNDTLDVAENGTTTIGRKFKLDAGQEIELVTGQSSIVMKSDGTIDIKGLKITIDGTTKVMVKSQEVVVDAGFKVEASAGATMKLSSGGMLDAKASAKLGLKGALLDMSADGIATLGGALIKIG